ncbi:MAG TPA: phosphoadenylyl-sulfate reductase [Azospirillaceae bacterium]|nr:phosphoadenylyl-sulfate reductase [Azospirillaceae bacterium]
MRRAHPRTVLESAIEAFGDRLALVSSFGAESAVLLDMVAAIDPATPVIFLNTGKLFGETLRYRTRLVERLGLTDVREVKPDPADLQRTDPDGVVWAGNPDACCHVRKTLPLERALAGFGAWITGRKRFQGATRAGLPVLEAADGRVKVNPLAGWSRDRLLAYLDARDLPRHPLEADGYLSIGCMPCTDRVAPGEDVRAGRWRGSEKTECGIHLPLLNKSNPVGA